MQYTFWALLALLLIVCSCLGRSTLKKNYNKYTTEQSTKNVLSHKYTYTLNNSLKSKATHESQKRPLDSTHTMVGRMHGCYVLL